MRSPVLFHWILLKLITIHRSYQHHLRQSHRRLQVHLQSLGLDTPPTPLAGYMTGGVLPIYIGLFALWVYLYMTARSFWGYFAAAVAIGAWWHQITFLGHDMGHTHITGDWWTDRFLGICVADFLGGLSIAWWYVSPTLYEGRRLRG